jgi:hypothetical protein
LQGFKSNSILIEALLADSTYDILAFVETWQHCYSRAFLKHAAACKYQVLYIPAALSTAGRNKGGSLMFIKRSLRVSSVFK